MLIIILLLHNIIIIMKHNSVNKIRNESEQNSGEMKQYNYRPEEVTYHDVSHFFELDSVVFEGVKKNKFNFVQLR